MSGRSPIFSILVRYAREGVGEFEAFLESMKLQSFRRYEVIILGIPQDEMSTFGKLQMVKFVPGLTLSTRDVHSIDAVDLCRGTYFLILQLEDLLRPDALECLAGELNHSQLHRKPDVIIFDFGMRDNERQTFLPGWDPDLIRYNDYFQSAACFSTAFVRRIEGGLDCLEPYEIAKAIERNDGFVVHIAQTLLITRLKRSEVRPFQLDRYSNLPVSVIIPNKDGVRLLPRCLKVFENLTSPFEIIVVDNASQDPRTWQMYEGLQQSMELTVVPFDRTFNYSAMINRGVEKARFASILLLNNDVFISSPQAIATAVNYANSAGVGVVGSVLRYPDGSVQHAGIVLSKLSQDDYDTSHVLRYARDTEEPHIGALTSPRNWLSVTGAFQAMRKAVFLEAGGYDEVNLPIEFNDVDFCLRVISSGSRVVCLPLKGVLHDESQTRSKLEQRMASSFTVDAYRVMTARWNKVYEKDPFYNSQLNKAARENAGSRLWITNLEYVLNRVRALIRKATAEKPGAFEGNYPERAKMPSRLHSGVCVVAPFRTDHLLRSAAIRMATAARLAGLDVSVFDCSSAYAGEELNGIPLRPFPDGNVTLYFGNLLHLENDKYSLGEGRIRVLVLCEFAEPISSAFGDDLRLFDQIWVSSEIQATNLKDVTSTSVHIIPKGRTPASSSFDSRLDRSDSPSVEAEILGEWIRALVKN